MTSASQIVTQLFISPKVLGITAAIMFILGIIPNMPHFVFLTIAAGLGYGAWVLAHKPIPARPQTALQPPTIRWGSQHGTICNRLTNWAWNWAIA
jgi:flagellar biosynthesis component FlhA